MCASGKPVRLLLLLCEREADRKLTLTEEGRARRKWRGESAWVGLLGAPLEAIIKSVAYL